MSAMWPIIQYLSLASQDLHFSPTLRLGAVPPPGNRLIAAASTTGMQLSVVSIPSVVLHDLYEAPLVLIRPDQIVAWRGFDDEAAPEVVARLLGKTPSQGRQ